MSDNKIIQLTDDQLKSLVEKTVHDTLVRLGVDATNPIEMQHDFQHLREWREATGAFRNKGILVIITTIIAGVLAAAWVGFKSSVFPT